MAWTRDRGLDPHLNHLERLIVRKDDPRADEYGAFIGGDPELSGDLVDAIRHPITKILAAGEPPLPSELAPLARERFDGLAAVTISHPRFLEFTAPGVSKGRAIRWLARRLKIPLGAVLAIGDQWNDIEMLAEVGHGAAMPTAPSEVLAAARYVAPAAARGGRGADDRGAGAGAAGRGVGCRGPTGRGGDGDSDRADGRVGLRAGRGRGRGMSARTVRDDAAGRAEAIEVLRGGGIVALPTDTVYGIAVALDAPGGIERLFRVKNRPPDRGIMLLLEAAAQAASIGVMGPAATALADACWPGGLTVVVPQRPDVTLPAALTGGTPTIGLRVPDHAAPRALAAAVGPLPTTSANVSGLPEATRRRRDPGPARGGRRPDPRRWPGAWRAALDRGRLHRRAAGDPARRGRAGGPHRRDPRQRGRRARPLRPVAIGDRR